MTKTSTFLDLASFCSTPPLFFPRFFFFFFLVSRGGRGFSLRFVSGMSFVAFGVDEVPRSVTVTNHVAAQNCCTSRLGGRLGGRLDVRGEGTGSWHHLGSTGLALFLRICTLAERSEERL